MQVTTLQPPPTDLTLVNHGGSRSPGLHVTEVIHALDRLQHPGKAEVDHEGWEDAAFFGFGWERVWEMATGELLSSISPTKVIRPGEFYLDGMYLSPDGMCLEAEPPMFSRPRLLETKFSWRSVGSSPPESRWDWRMQVMAYCYCLHLTDCELVALYPMGNYRPPKPVLRRELWVFEQAELDAAWEMLVGGAEWLKRQQPE